MWTGRSLQDMEQSEILDSKFLDYFYLKVWKWEKWHQHRIHLSKARLKGLCDSKTDSTKFNISDKLVRLLMVIFFPSPLHKYCQHHGENLIVLIAELPFLTQQSDLVKFSDDTFQHYPLY